MVNSILTVLSSYYMSIFKLPSWVVRRMDKLRIAFLWKGIDNIVGFHYLANWDYVCKTKDQEGLRVKNLIQMNQSLLAKWA